MMKKLFTVSFFNFATKVLAALLVLATQVYISRYYLVDELADYSRLLNYINIATVLTGMGLNISAIYHLRKGYHAPNEASAERGLLQTYSSNQIFSAGLAAFSSASLLAFILLAVAGVSIYDSLLIAVFSLLNNLFFLHNSKAIADGKFGRYNGQMLAYACLHLLAIIVMVAARNTIDIRTVLSIQCGYLLLLNGMYFRKNNIALSMPPRLMHSMRSFFSYGRRIFITNSMGILLYSGDIILLDLLLPSAALAEYLLAATAIKFLWLGIDSIGLVIFPEFVRPSGEVPHTKTINRLFVIGTVLLVAAIATFYFVGDYLVNFIYGSSFTQLRDLLLLLMVATFGVMLYKFLSRFFAANDNWLPVYVALGAGILAEIVLILLWVPVFGIVGAAYASLAAYLLTGIIIAAWFYIGAKKYKMVVT